jgi:hypothetical protein
VSEQVLRLVDPAEHGVLAGEYLHRHDRVETLRLEDRVGAREIDVSGIPGQDLVGRSGALDAHRWGRLLVLGRWLGRLDTAIVLGERASGSGVPRSVP